MVGCEIAFSGGEIADLVEASVAWRPDTNLVECAQS